MSETIEGHGGQLVLGALKAFGVNELFTLSGGHIFPIFDAAHQGDVRIIDVRHEQSAVFAAEAVAKLQRRPGLAVLTAGPGVTNGVSGVTSAWFNGAPVVVLGGRAPQFRWGAGSLQEMDHVPIFTSITKHAGTVTATDDIGRAVRDAVGSQLAVTAKLNMDDGVPGGFWLDESIQVAQWLEADGSVDALELTAGSSLLNPMYLFTGDAPVGEFAAQFPPPIRLALRASGNRFLRSYPYQEAYLLDRARQFRAALRLPLILLGGITRKETMDLAMAEGFAFVAMARALLREPDLVQRIQADPRTRSLCVHCNKCMPTIYRGTHCVLAPDVLAPDAPARFSPP